MKNLTGALADGRYPHRPEDPQELLCPPVPGSILLSMGLVGGHGVRPVWWLLALVVAGVVAAALQWVPAGWPLVARLGAGVAAAVAAGAVGSYVSEWLGARRSARVGRDALAAASVLPVDGGPAGLLAPGRRVAEFVGRRDELADLIGWCEDGTAGRLRLVAGPGGVGKSRLALELCTRLEELGWTCVQVADGAEAAAVQTVRNVTGGRFLLVVDYAEVRSGLPALLRATAADNGAALRVLLLARSAGEWWQRLAVSEAPVRALLADAYRGEDLAAVVEADVSDAELVAAAIPRFAAALGVVEPPRVEVVSGPGRARILDLHATALVSVLDAAAAQAAGEVLDVVRVDVAGVLGELLAHEERFWLGTAGRAGLLDGVSGLRPQVLRRIVAATCLLGAATEEDAAALVARVPGAVASAKVVGWLRDLYPPHADGDWLGSLQPDRLAERLAVAELAASPVLADACLTDLNDRQATRAMTLLGRASTDETAAALLERLLPQLEHVIAELPADVDLLSALSNTIPRPTLAFAEADLAITRRILGLLPADRIDEQAYWLTWLGEALSNTDRLTEALPVAQESVRLWRGLAETHPDLFSLYLANSLSSLAKFHGLQGHWAEALSAAQESVQIWREVTQANATDDHRPDLASALQNLGIRYWEQGRLEEALFADQEAAQIWGELAEVDPDRFTPSVAGSLHNLGITLANLGRSGEGLSALQEAVRFRHGLAEADPDRYSPYLADSLTELGIRLAEQGRPAEALSAAQESVGIWRSLAETYPDRYRPGRADALHELGCRLAELGSPVEAISVLKEAVDIFRNLASEFPDRYGPHLETSTAKLAAIMLTAGND